MALAGTRPLRNGNKSAAADWNSKEKEEQRLVCRDIAEKLEPLPGVSFAEGPLSTVQAGNMVHLQSVFTVRTAPGLDSMALLADALHPTAAISGIPGNTAAAFIADHERYDRDLYAGYWGPVGLPCGTSLFVNIRCMKVIDHTAVIYAGAGITLDSDPEKEWEETILKSTTMEGLLR
jgi:isochorismate synthase